jgi:hypothetical protein
VLLPKVHALEFYHFHMNFIKRVCISTFVTKYISGWIMDMNHFKKFRYL